jgi:putative CocE/NonD family hydrolase
VRIFVMGAWNRWLELPNWPPPATELLLYLSTGRELSLAPGAAGSAGYVYDPSNPTPVLGGPLLGDSRYVYDNRPLEARPDVLTFTSAPLDREHVVIGSVDAELHVSSSTPHTDFFAKLCDVQPDGRSLNVCDGIIRVADRTWPDCVRVELSPTAYAFKTGNRLRLQISSGAFPRFSRNLGTGEPLGAGRTGITAQQQVLFGSGQPSRVRLSLWSGESSTLGRNPI